MHPTRKRMKFFFHNSYGFIQLKFYKILLFKKRQSGLLRVFSIVEWEDVSAGILKIFIMTMMFSLYLSEQKMQGSSRYSKFKDFSSFKPTNQPKNSLRVILCIQKWLNKSDSNHLSLVVSLEKDTSLTMNKCSIGLKLVSLM